MNFRFIVVIVIYAFVVIFLPKQPDIARLLYQLQTIDPNISIGISAGALAIASLASYFLWRQPNGLMHTRPSIGLYIAHMGLIGVIFSSVFDVFYWLSGQSTDITGLILIPTAFMVAEGVYLLIQWRMNRPAD